MKVAVVFPSVVYREGPEAVARLMGAIERLGYDEILVLDHVVMGHDTPERTRSYYPADIPLLEALTTLAFAASATSTIGLGTGVLVLPQRQVPLVAKQVATVDLLSGGRVRLGVGLGWHAPEYEALGEDFGTRGRRLDEAVALLRAYWREPTVDYEGRWYRAEAMAMEPKPPRGDAIPVWIGGAVSQTLERVGRYGDGWMGQLVKDDDSARRLLDRIRHHATAAGRDPDTIGTQLGVSAPRGENEREFFKDPARVSARLVELRDLGFTWGSVNLVPVFQAGYRSVDAMIDYLGELATLIEADL